MNVFSAKKVFWRSSLIALCFFLSVAVSYAQEEKKAPGPAELPVVIVNAGNLDRSGIADLLDAINAQRPKVVGVNFEFVDKRAGDEKLVSALKNTRNLIMNCTEEQGSLIRSYFQGLEYGQCNFRRNQKEEVDYFPPVLEINGEQFEHFGLKALKYWDFEKYKALKAQLGDVSAHGKVTFMKIDFLEKNVASFQSIDYSDLINAPKEFLKDKIVLVGYLGEKIDATNYVTDPEDAFTVPVHHRHHREKNPMYATVILANIIQTLTRGELKSFHHE
jgi:CHASE2 domain-containing sensor protein